MTGRARRDAAPRISRAAIVAQLKLAARKGDRVALAHATAQMKLWAMSPRYWEKYLDLLGHPLARLVDLTVIKQGERIARQKGWVRGRRRSVGPPVDAERSGRPKPGSTEPVQPSLFVDLPT